jgi:hypothetical protein
MVDTTDGTILFFDTLIRNNNKSSTDRLSHIDSLLMKIL